MDVVLLELWPTVIFNVQAFTTRPRTIISNGFASTIRYNNVSAMQADKPASLQLGARSPWTWVLHILVPCFACKRFLQAAEIDGLHKKMIEARMPGARMAQFAAVARNGDQHQLLTCKLLPQLLRHLKSIDTGKTNVQKHDVGLMGGDILQN
jgi:hypothetical protein